MQSTTFLPLMLAIRLVASAAMAAPALPDEKLRQVRLEDLGLAAVKTGWGNAQADRSIAGEPIRMGGRKFEHGLGVHAASQINVVLDGKTRHFHAVVGINDTGRNEPGSVQFEVTGDGRKLFESPVIRGGEPPQTIDLELGGIRRLQLTVADGGNINSDHANWADATFSYAGNVPQIIDPEKISEALYPPEDRLTASPGMTSYFVDPAHGNDSNAGKSAKSAWKNLSKVNALRLAPGDEVVIAPGIHLQSLKPSARGTREKPVTIRFLPGRHEFRADQAIRLAYFVSNSADAPLLPRPIAIVVKNARHLKLLGDPGAEICLGSRMTEFVNDQSEDIAYRGLTFDFVRPTVSEFRVLEVAANQVTIQVAAGSSYAIDNGRLRWTGDLGSGNSMVQQADPQAKTCWRMGFVDLLGKATAEDLGDGKVRLSYSSGQPGMIVGRQFQFRNITRDTTSALNNRSKNITLSDCKFHSLPGMGIVSQFTENITYQRVRVVPRPETIRTCPAWADCFHFSGCRGEILIDSCAFSGTQDDPINVHGTHLRIIGKPAANQLLLRFMQPQTYGFAAFQPGDRIEFINHQTLRSYASNTVSAVERRSDKDWLLTLRNPAAEFGKDDVIDNVSWYPNVTVRNCSIDTCSTRGILMTSRGKCVIERCTFTRTKMAAILVENDASGWFESGPIRDLTIRDNRFISCSIEINPHNSNNDPALPVHENIRITNNFFDGAGISAKGVKGLTITGNRSPKGQIPIQINPSCTDVKVENNANTATQPQQ